MVFAYLQGTDYVNSMHTVSANFVWLVPQAI